MHYPKSPIDKLLRAWGHVYGERRPPEWDEALDPANATNHPIARAMEFAGGNESPATRSAGAMRKIRKVPSWGFDPVVCTETRSFRISTIDDIPTQVQRVQNAALELYRIDTLRGTVLRHEYCKRGTQTDKAAELVMFGFPNVTPRLYREKLASAVGWMECKLMPICTD